MGVKTMTLIKQQSTSLKFLHDELLYSVFHFQSLSTVFTIRNVTLSINAKIHMGQLLNSLLKHSSMYSRSGMSKYVDHW